MKPKSGPNMAADRSTSARPLPFFHHRNRRTNAASGMGMLLPRASVRRLRDAERWAKGAACSRSAGST
ncbi:hypothetical protein D3C87_1405870 [compost metagenome]